MTKAADKTPPDRRVTLTPREDGVLIATWPRKQVRFLLSDGSTVDVDTERDDSDLRGAVVAHTGVDRIEGSTTLRLPPPAQDLGNG